MILEEFKDIFKDAFLLIDTASERDIIMAFNYGLMVFLIIRLKWMIIIWIKMEK